MAVAAKHGLLLYEETERERERTVVVVQPTRPASECIKQSSKSAIDFVCLCFDIHSDKQQPSTTTLNRSRRLLLLLMFVVGFIKKKSGCDVLS